MGTCSPLEVVEEAPSKVRADVDSVLPHSGKNDGRVAFEVFDPVMIGQSLLQGHGVLVLDRKPVLGDADQLC